MDDFNDILNFDPILEAERITGKSADEDEATKALAHRLLQESNERRTDELRLRDDFYYDMPFDEAVKIALSMGFTPVYVQSVVDNKRRYSSGNPVHYNAYWRKGVLLTLESYGKESDTRGVTVNNARISFNWRSKDGTTSWPNVPFSGGWKHRSPGFEDVEDDPWTLEGDIVVREGLKHYLDILEGNGTLLETWYCTPRMLHIHSYAEEADEKFDRENWPAQLRRMDVKNLERINEFAEPARSAILAGRAGHDWSDCDV